MKNPSWILLENGLYLIHNLSSKEIEDIQKNPETSFIWEIKKRGAKNYGLKKDSLFYNVFL